MELKVIQMVIYYVLSTCDDEKKTKESCIDINKLLIAMVKNKETKADELLNLFPLGHPVSKIYLEIKDNNLLELLEFSKEKFEKAEFDNEILINIEKESEVEELSKKIAGEI